jgi:hypothetical protein
LLDLHQRFLIEIARVAEDGLDEKERRGRVEAIIALQIRALLRQRY